MFRAVLALFKRGFEGLDVDIVGFNGGAGVGPGEPAVEVDQAAAF